MALTALLPDSLGKPQGTELLLKISRQIVTAQVPANCSITRETRDNNAARGGILAIGQPNQQFLEIPEGLDRAGLCVVGGLNPIAALEEAGIETTSAAMSDMVEFDELVPFKEAAKDFS